MILYGSHVHIFTKNYVIFGDFYAFFSKGVRVFVRFYAEYVIYAVATDPSTVGCYDHMQRGFLLFSPLKKRIKIPILHITPQNYVVFSYADNPFRSFVVPHHVSHNVKFFKDRIAFFRKWTFYKCPIPKSFAPSFSESCVIILRWICNFNTVVLYYFTSFTVYFRRIHGEPGSGSRIVVQNNGK